MGCGCNKRRQVYPGGETLGWYVVLPDGTRLPEGGGLFFSVVEAKAAYRASGISGGTIKRLTKSG